LKKRLKKRFETLKNKIEKLARARARALLRRVPVPVSVLAYAGPSQLKITQGSPRKSKKSQKSRLNTKKNTKQLKDGEGRYLGENCHSIARRAAGKKKIQSAQKIKNKLFYIKFFSQTV
jgi:hypothetical protein